MSDAFGDIEWTDVLENNVKANGERAHGLSWLHKKSEARFSRLRNFSDLPVVILGVVNAATSVGSGTLFDDPKWASVGVGIIAMIGALISAISSYFKWAAKAEAHRIVSIQYGKLSRWIALQMSLPRSERLSASDCIKYIKSEYDRLQEVSPLIPPEAIDEFRKRFNGPEYRDISKPIECNGLEKITVVPDVPILALPSGNA